MLEWFIGAILIGAAIEDWKHNTISDFWVIALSVITCYAVCYGFVAIGTAILGLLVVGGVFLVGAVKTGAVGGGDVKTCGVLGALFGVEEAFVMIAYSLVFMIIVSKFRGVKESAFAPFLLMGFLVYVGTKNLL